MLTRARASGKPLRGRSLATLSIAGGVPVPRIPVKDLVCPGDRIGHTDPRRLRTCPEFKVPWPVVVLHAIAVMNRLLGEHMAAE